jgi:hypothetical protein
MRYEQEIKQMKKNQPERDLATDENTSRIPSQSGSQRPSNDYNARRVSQNNVF